MGFLLIYVISKDRAKTKRKNQLLAGTETTPSGTSADGKEGIRSKILLAACYAAKADSKVDTDEIETIIKIVGQVSEIPVTREEIQEIMDLIPAELTDYEAINIAKGLDGDQKWMIVHACILMAASDGHLDNSELNLVFKLGVAFGFSEKEIFERFKMLGLTKDE